MSVLERFADGQGGFFDTAVDAPRLVRRPRDPSDGVTPSGASGAAHALLTLGALTGASEYTMAADSAIASLRQLATASPRFAGWAWSTIAARIAGPIQVAIVRPHGADGSALHRMALSSTSPGLVVAVARGGRRPDRAAAPRARGHRRAADRLPLPRVRVRPAGHATPSPCGRRWGADAPALRLSAG